MYQLLALSVLISSGVPQALHTYICSFMQTLMSVKVATTVMRMHNALTQREVSLAHATLATLEMAGLNAQVEIDCCS